MNQIDHITAILIAYLGEHEREIAQDVDGYGVLYPVFCAMFEKKPRGNPNVKPLTQAIEQEIH